MARIKRVFLFSLIVIGMTVVSGLCYMSVLSDQIQDIELSTLQKIEPSPTSSSFVPQEQSGQKKVTISPSAITPIPPQNDNLPSSYDTIEQLAEVAGITLFQPTYLPETDCSLYGIFYDFVGQVAIIDYQCLIVFQRSGKQIGYEMYDNPQERLQINGYEALYIGGEWAQSYNDTEQTWKANGGPRMILARDGVIVEIRMGANISVIDKEGKVVIVSPTKNVKETLLKVTESLTHNLRVKYR